MLLIWWPRGWRSLAQLDMCYFWREPCLIEGQRSLAVFNTELLKVHFTWLPFAGGQIGECKKKCHLDVMVAVDIINNL